MSSLKRWRRVSQGQFHRWETPGHAFQGVWRGIRDGRFGLLGTLETEVGPVAFPLPAALRVRLVQVQPGTRSEEHTSELQSRLHLVCRLLLEKKKKKNTRLP